MSERFYTTSEVAKILGITKMTLTRWIKKGKIKADVTTSEGYNYFSAEHVEQLKSVTSDEQSVTPSVTSNDSSVTLSVTGVTSDEQSVTSSVTSNDSSVTLSVTGVTSDEQSVTSSVTSNDSSVTGVTGVTSENDTGIKTEDTPDYSYLMMQAVKNVEKFDYHKTRGLTNETLRRFGCGYLPPGTKGKEGKPMLKGWWWLYFPTGKNGRSGNCRALKNKDFRNFGGKALFNMQALHKDVVYIVESEICAMTLYQEAEVNVVGLSGTPNVKKVFEAVKELDKKPRIVIVMTDNDGSDGSDGTKASKGKLAALELITGLKKLGVFAFNAVSYLDDCKDPNEYFQKHGRKALQKMAIKAMVDATIAHGEEEIKEQKALEQPAQQSKEIIPLDAIPLDEFISLPNLDLELICPEGYSIKETGIQKIVWDKKLLSYKTIRVSYASIVISKAIKNIDDRRHKRELSCYDRITKAWTKITAENAVIFNSRSILQLATEGLTVASNTAGMLVEYLSVFDYVNAQNIPRAETVNNIGWRGDAFLPISKDTKYELDSTIKAKVEEKFQSKGSKEPIIALIKELKEKNFDIANTIIGATLAAPMRRKVFDHNIAIHFAGLTGCGKTAISTLAYSLFYSTKVEMPRFNGTRNGFERIFAGLRDLPVFIDDANNLSDKERALAEKLIYDYVNGIPRVRTNKNLEDPILEPFYGTLLTTGEHFLTTNTSAGGAKTREMEFNGGSKYLNDEFSRVIYRVTKKNYGLFLYDWINIIKDNQETMKAMYDNFVYYDLPDSVQGKIPRHINNIAAIATANTFFDIHFLGMTEREARNEELRSAVRILQTLPDYAQIADYMRAKPIIRDMVISNLKKFVRFDKYHNGNYEDFELIAEGPETYGIIKKDSIGILRNVLDKWLFDNGFSELTKTQLADDGFIVREGRHLESYFRNYPTKGTRTKMYKIPLKFIFEEMPE